MHELSICTAIARIADRIAAGRQIKVVRADIGHLRQVVPETLLYSWEMVVFGTTLEGVALEVRDVPAVLECRKCGALTTLDDPIFRCAVCSSTDTAVVSGEEMLVTSLDVVAEAT